LRTKRKTLENIIYFVLFVKLFQAPTTTATFAQYMPKNKDLPLRGQARQDASISCRQILQAHRTGFLSLPAGGERIGFTGTFCEFP